MLEFINNRAARWLFIRLSFPHRSATNFLINNAGIQP
jgi:hypothetical protein